MLLIQLNTLNERIGRAKAQNAEYNVSITVKTKMIVVCVRTGI